MSGFIHDIKARPRITTEVPDEFESTFTRFNKFVLSRTVETQQSIADMRGDQPALEGNEAIHDAIGQILDLTDNGRELAYDEATQQAIFDSDDFAASVSEFRRIKHDDATIEQSRRGIALLGLAIYAERAVQYKHQHKPKYRSA